MPPPQSWDNLTPEQSEGLSAIIAGHQAGTVDTEAAIAQAGAVLDIPAAQVPNAIAAMSRSWMEENRELLEWASSVVGK